MLLQDHLTSVKVTRSLNNIFNFKESEKSLTMDSILLLWVAYKGESLTGKDENKSE